MNKKLGAVSFQRDDEWRISLNSVEELLSVMPPILQWKERNIVK